MKYLTEIEYKGHTLYAWTLDGRWHKDGCKRIWYVDIPELFTLGAHWTDRDGNRLSTTIYCDTLSALRRIVRLLETGKVERAEKLLSANQNEVSPVMGKLSHINFSSGNGRDIG